VRVRHSINPAQNPTLEASEGKEKVCRKFLGTGKSGTRGTSMDDWVRTKEESETGVEKLRGRLGTRTPEKEGCGTPLIKKICVGGDKSHREGRRVTRLPEHPTKKA